MKTTRSTAPFDVIPPDELQESRTSWRRWALSRRLCLDALVEAGFERHEALHIVTAQSLATPDYSQMGAAYQTIAGAFDAIVKDDGDDA